MDNSLRKAAEMALETLETTWGDGSEGTLKQWEETIQALHQALTPEVTPEETRNVDNLDISEECVHKTDKSKHDVPQP